MFELAKTINCGLFNWRFLDDVINLRVLLLLLLLSFAEKLINACRVIYEHW